MELCWVGIFVRLSAFYNTLEYKCKYNYYCIMSKNKKSELLFRYLLFIHFIHF